MGESIEMEDFEIAFEEASRFVKANPSLFNDEQKLRLYGLYKLAKVGKCNVEKPGGLFNWERKAMWDSWSSLSEKNIKNPHNMYVDYLTGLIEDWQTHE